jgi:hypothetical protein
MKIEGGGKFIIFNSVYGLSGRNQKNMWRK